MLAKMEIEKDESSISHGLFKAILMITTVQGTICAIVNDLHKVCQTILTNIKNQEMREELFAAQFEFSVAAVNFVLKAHGLNPRVEDQYPLYFIKFASKMIYVLDEITNYHKINKQPLLDAVCEFLNQNKKSVVLL
jgi:hypothetical protein